MFIKKDYFCEINFYFVLSPRALIFIDIISSSKISNSDEFKIFSNNEKHLDNILLEGTCFMTNKSRKKLYNKNYLFGLFNQ